MVPASPQTSAQINALRGSLWEFLLQKVVEALQGFFNFGVSAFDQLASWAENIPVIGTIIQWIEQLTGINLSTAFQGIDLTNPGAILNSIVVTVQKIVTALFNGLTGSIATAVHIAEIPLALFGQLAAIPSQIIETIFGAVAGLEARMTAIQNNPTGPTQTDDFSTTSVTAWTAITGTLAVSTMGPYIQTSTRCAAYIGTPSTARVPATDKHGIQITIDGKMHGACRAWICGNATMSNYAAIEVYSGFDGDSVRLLTGVSPTLAMVQKKVDFIASPLQNKNAFDLWYEPGTNTFHVLKNGTSLFDWVDSTNIVTHGSSKRNVGIVSNAFNNNSNGFWGPGIRKVTYYDK